MAAGKIVDLRKILAERFPQEPRPPTDQLATGLPLLDTALGGGLTKSGITELSSAPPSAGSATLLATLLQRMARERSFLALIDGRDSFDPESCEQPWLRHLLWIRCRHTSEAMQAADLLLRDGNFPLVILDLVLNPLLELRRIPQSNWYRLQRLVETAPTALLVLTPQSMISSAQWKLRLENRWRLPDLGGERAELTGQLHFRVERAQPNKWRGAEKMAEAN
jgi:hypothetical protein